MCKNILAATAIISFLSACSNSHTITTQDGSKVSVAQGKDGASSLHAEGKDGASLDINTGKAITDYPSDVPLYVGKSAMDMKSGEKHARIVAIQTPDSLDKISAFYKSELESKGWKVETSLNTDKMVMYKASKDNRDLVVQIGTDGSGKQSTVSQTLADR
jgi:hypothetical protein